MGLYLLDNKACAPDAQRFTVEGLAMIRRAEPQWLEQIPMDELQV